MSIYPTTHELEQFVQHNFGDKYVKSLQNIHRGGINNAKGNQYEQYYLLFKIFQLANQEDFDLEQHYLQSQPYAFVDDICYIDKQHNIKHNYQLKNSQGQTATWSKELEQRFFYQQRIDIELLKFTQSKNYLIVSDENKAKNNQQQIKNITEQQHFQCEHFPYYEKLLDLLHDETFKSYLDAVIMPTATFADRDFAVRLILNALNIHTEQSIISIFKQAESDAYPNPFIKFRTISSTLPEWFQIILNNLQSTVDYDVQYNQLSVIFNQCLTISVRLDVILKQQPQQISTAQALKQFLIHCSMQELSDPNT